MAAALCPMIRPSRLSLGLPTRRQTPSLNGVDPPLVPQLQIL